MENIKKQIESILNEKLGSKGFYTKVSLYLTPLGRKENLAIQIATTDKCINGVNGQLTDLVSLSLSNDLLLETQCFGGCGGGSLYRNINPNNADEKYLAMKGVKVGFRKPQQNEKPVLNAISKFADNYLNTLKEIKSLGLLRYTNLVDYDKLLV
jgi:hypothetical protein